MYLGRLYRHLDVLLGRPQGKQSKADSQGKRNHPQSLRDGLSFLLSCPSVPTTQILRWKEHRWGAVVCLSFILTSQHSFGLPREHLISTSTPLSVQTGFLTSMVLGICSGPVFVPEACPHSLKCSVGTPALPSWPPENVSSCWNFRHVTLCLAMPLVVKMCIFLAYLGTCSCCFLKLLFPSHILDIFQPHPTPSFTLRCSLSCHFHTWGIIFFLKNVSIKLLKIILHVHIIHTDNMQCIEITYNACR